MDLMGMALSREVPDLHAKGVQLHFPGDRSGLSSKVASGLDAAKVLTAENRRLVLNVCFNYGGRWDVCQAAEVLRQRGVPINPGSVSSQLALAHVPDPDLCIRTGGEMRISNFLIWQLAYAELYFSPALWPDFDAAEFDRALDAYRQRERRFGQTSEQRMGVLHTERANG